MALAAVAAAAKLKKAAGGECVKVVIRCRPPNRKEREAENAVIIEMDKKTSHVALHNPKANESEPPKQFTFDGAYFWETSQRELYDETAFPIVESVIEGYNGTIFAYGQTGTGKSHTMQGPPEPKEQHGIIPNAFNHIFDTVNTNTSAKEFLVRASYLEIYNEEIRDLLGKDPKAKLELKSNKDKGVYVKDLTNIVVKTVAEIDHVLEVGQGNRSVGATLMNQDSSRSHSIFSIVIETSEMSEKDNKPHIRAGKLNLVDLAGSERQGKTGATGERLKEATKINLSLSALGNCISALVDGKSTHVPYRDSKLTRMLEDSLGGNTKTCMIATMGPADYNYDESLSTLRYANRAKSIKNKPRINEDPKDTMLREMQEEIAKLKAAIEAQASGGGGAPVAVGGGPKKVKKKKEKKAGGGGAAAGNATKPDGRPLTPEKKIIYKEVIEERVVEGVSEEELAKIAEALEEEKNSLLSEKDAQDEEFRRQQELAEQNDAELEEAEHETDELQAQLEQLEAKILHSEGLGDQNAELALELRKKQAATEQLRHEEQHLAEQLAEKEEGLAEQDQNFRTLEEAVHFKTQLLEKRFKQYQEVKTDIMDIQEEYAEEREDLLETIRAMTKSLKLKHTVIENFIPNSDVEKMEERCIWDDDAETWILQKRTEEQGLEIRRQRPQSALGTRSHQTRHSIINANRGNARYKCENIITLELEMPSRTTVDYDPQCFNPDLQYEQGYAEQYYGEAGYEEQYDLQDYGADPQYQDQQYQHEYNSYDPYSFNGGQGQPEGQAQQEGYGQPGW